MFSEDLRYTNYKTGVNSFKVHINASWITIRAKDGTVIYKREPTQDDWYDESHKEIVNAIRQLEAALEKVTSK